MKKFNITIPLGVIFLALLIYGGSRGASIVEFLTGAFFIVGLLVFILGSIAIKLFWKGFDRAAREGRVKFIMENEEE